MKATPTSVRGLLLTLNIDGFEDVCNIQSLGKQE